jgi:outer membrane lipoprotein-sorting protein
MLREARSTAGLAILFLLGATALTGCSVKRTVKVEVPQKVLEAKTASLDELVALAGNYSEKLRTLSSTSLKISYVSGKLDSGTLQQYRSAPGYVLLKSPDALRLNIQNPLTKTAIAELASRGDDFALWFPRDNKYFVGRNSSRELELESGQNAATFTARPFHIYEAIIPRSIPISNPQMKISLEEDRDTTAKYYVVSVFRESGPHRLRVLRRIWFERSALAVVRQKTFEEDGSVSSIITYSNLAPVEGLLMPLLIRLERPGDGYSLDMEFKNWRANSEIPDTSFTLAKPPAAQVVQLKEKGKK